MTGITAEEARVRAEKKRGIIGNFLEKVYKKIEEEADKGGTSVEIVFTCPFIDEQAVYLSGDDYLTAEGQAILNDLKSKGYGIGNVRSEVDVRVLVDVHW
jgi:hypothetical protein